MSNENGYVYAIGIAQMSYVKIGSTRGTVEKRLRALQTAHPYQLHIVATKSVAFDMRMRLERGLHRLLHAQRRTGEWFEISLDQEIFDSLVEKVLAALTENRYVPELHARPYDYDVLTFGQQVANIRKERQWSQQELGDRAGLPADVIRDIEDGTEHDVSLYAAISVTKALGHSLDYLVGFPADIERGTYQYSILSDRDSSHAY